MIKKKLKYADEEKKNKNLIKKNKNFLKVAK